MLVSQSNNFVLIHIQKTGGVSISEVLKGSVPDATNHQPRHMFASQAVERVEDWEKHFKFAFVRNPWDRLVSWYSMINKIKQARASKQPLTRRQRIRLKNNPFLRYVVRNAPTFEDFIRNCTNEIEIGDGFYYSSIYNQIDYLTDENGDLLVDYIGRFERFTEDLTVVLDKVELHADSIPHKNPSAHDHYSSFYTDETESIVRERFSRDIDYFGYEFERVGSSG